MMMVMDSWLVLVLQLQLNDCKLVLQLQLTAFWGQKVHTQNID
jgi:hypothetical protein